MILHPASFVGLLVYAYFLWAFSYTLIWVGGYIPYLPQPLLPLFQLGSIDRNHWAGVQWGSEDFSLSLVWNIALLLLFASTHLVMARMPFKRFVTENLYSWRYERAIYVFVANTCLVLLFYYWTPLDDVLYVLPGSVRDVLFWFPVIGYAIVFIASVNIDHLHLFGVKQALGIFPVWRGIPVNEPVECVTVGLYNFVRHPLMTGFLIAFWGMRDITVGHLLFASVTTVFIWITVFLFEEPDLVDNLGAAYSHYQDTVPAFFPGPSLCPVAPRKRKRW